LSYLDHDVAPDGARRAPQRPVTSQRTSAGSSAPPMLDLQRLAGNAAVSQAIRSGQFDSTPVQRLPAEATDTDETMDEEELEEGADEFEAEAESEDLENELEEEMAEDEQEEYQEESG
jgi:hypothetical protein